MYSSIPVTRPERRVWPFGIACIARALEDREADTIDRRSGSRHGHRAIARTSGMCRVGIDSPRDIDPYGRLVGAPRRASQGLAITKPYVYTLQPALSWGLKRAFYPRQTNW